MKAKIKKQETFDFEIDGEIHCGFTKDSEWEGLVKYSNSQGVIITALVNRFEEIVFGSFNQAVGVDIIQCSPCFIGGK